MCLLVCLLGFLRDEVPCVTIEDFKFKALKNDIFPRKTSYFSVGEFFNLILEARDQTNS